MITGFRSCVVWDPQIRRSTTIKGYSSFVVLDVQKLTEPPIFFGGFFNL